ncbi:MAG: GLPGLI family protein [Flavobacteriaceae bacterium]|nr:GLPGLI family protein [Flavobacteriaceae bacterium]
MKKLITLFAILIALPSFAQDFQGKAFYKSKTTIDMSGWGGRNGQQMSEEQKKRIAERMKNMFEKTYILTFNKSESIYKEEEKLDAPGQGRGWAMMGSLTGGAQYKNVKDQAMLQEQEFFGKQFLIKDSLPKLEWVMGTETKQIGQYTAFMATATKKVSETDWMNMRRRRNGDDEKKKDSVEQDSTNTKQISEDIEIPKEITVTAWYTPQIPINQGPGEYWGLPGLILEVQSGRTTILCSKIVMNPEEKEEIKKPSKGEEVTQKEYEETVKKKMEEMREMYGGRRGRGDRIRG